jgi:hypothetical protein
MGKKSAPPAPDYTAAAEKTAASQQDQLTQQTWANRANQYSPWGSETWSSSQQVDPATGKPVTQWSQTTNLNPDAQHALDSQLALQSGRSDLANSLMPRAQQEFGQAMDWSQAQPWAQAPQAGNLQQYTSPYGFGGPRVQNTDTSRQQTPGLNTNLGAGAGNVQQGLNFGGVQDVAGSAAQRQKAEDAIYQSATSRLDPQWQQRQASMDSDLANKGISMNSAAYSNAMRDFGNSRNDAYNQAQMAAITGAGAEAQRNYGMDIGLRQQQVGEIGQQGQFANAAQNQDFSQRMQAGQGNNAALGQGFSMGEQARQGQLSAQQQLYNQQLGAGTYGMGQQQQAFGQQQAAGNQNFQQNLQAAQFQNQMRQQQIAEQMQQRGFSLNEINAIISGQQVGMPQFAGYNQAGQGQGVDYTGAAQNQYSAAMDQQNASSGLFGQLMGAAGQMGAAYLGKPSDRRVKTSIKRIGRHPRGFGVYTYRYIGERGIRVGVMAQEVRRYMPHVVHADSGILRVEYDRL